MGTQALDEFLTRLPVALRGLDTDNDSVFMNEILVGYCDRHEIELTRSRAYRKNDQDLMGFLADGRWPGGFPTFSRISLRWARSGAPRTDVPRIGRS